VTAAHAAVLTFHQAKCSGSWDMGFKK